MTSPLRLSLLAAFSADGRVYRAFGHYIAAANGRLLLVPVPLVCRDQSEIVPGCPVSVEELSAILDAPGNKALPLAADTQLYRRLEPFAPAGWHCDRLALMPNDRWRVLRAVNDNGIRYAEVLQ